MKGWTKHDILLKILVCGIFSFASLEAQADDGIAKTIDTAFGWLNGKIASVLFFDILFFVDGTSIPLAVAWLVIGAIYFTFKMRFINIRGFGHAIKVTTGKFDDADDEGDVSHFQALSAALSATVGLGNIAGVAIAVMMGGPGAVFWMIIAGFLGMSSKFTECTLGQIYREIRPDGKVMGGAMEYLSRGLAEKGMAGLGKVLAIVFCLFCIGGSLGGGNAFQVSQSMGAFVQIVPILAENNWLYGVLMATLVGIVILGGLPRIAYTAARIVPTMCLLYVGACAWVILSHVSEIPGALRAIVFGAFTPEAGYGGVIGVLVTGFQRAAFSNEAGIGSAAIAHSAAKTKYPIREGIVALLEPFIDTIVVCTMTAVVIVITGAYNNPDFATLIENKEGAALTSKAFEGVISWFPVILSTSVVLFAYSTMISWSYYGERCWSYLFGEKTAIIYRIIFVVVVFLASIVSASNVLDFSDLMILSMAFPNILGVLILSGKVKADLITYWDTHHKKSQRITP